ncbi:MAG: hypothetical protein DK841_08480 [Candidatus Melainabacteria bacterium]|jgi:hypothetical protein|nr:MAG: hypothetical protein DK841_08480 [Candidatus Melainabacteria bacterium]
MNFEFNETRLFEHKDNELNDSNSYLILSKSEAVPETDFENVIQIIDESGMEVNCTYDKFVEIFDKEGLAGFIM